jgi:tRNA threonylcarbamoyladenosine modification (KEOPS) complex  Pcc1 subunit
MGIVKTITQTLSPMNTLSRMLSICCIAILTMLCGQMTKANASDLVDDYDLVDQRNPSAGVDGLKEKEKAVILIHGWNPEEEVNPLRSGDWHYLLGQLQTKLDRTSNDWAVVNFNWARSAATGRISGILTSAIRKSVSPPVVASVNANSIGYSYARSLASSCPKLRRVHFIAHSAGTWLARSAMLELIKINPMVVCELTLLDPFVAGRLEGVDNPYTNARLEELTDPAISGYRVWWAQNLYSKDIPTGVFTKGDLNWVGGLSSGQNFLVDGSGITSYNPYGSHAGPIRFYADTIAANIPNYAPPADLNTSPNPPAWRDYGAESGFWNAEASFPKILPLSPTGSDNIFRPYGQNVQLKVNLSYSIGCSYQWYLLQDRVTESGKILTPVPAPLIGNGPSIEVPVGSSKVQYVCEVENSFHRKTFSSIFSVSPDLGAALITIPSISGMSPSSPSADISGSQLVSVAGRGFQASANTIAILTSPSGATSTYIPTITSSTQLSFSHSFSGEPGTWTLVIKKGTNSSAPLTFRVTSATPTTAPLVLSRVAIENLPSSVFEGQTMSNIGIRKYYSDGTNSSVTSPTSANWGIQYGTLTFSSPSSFVVSQVTADVSETVTATYTEGGITKTSPAATITVLNNTTGGGVVTGEIVKNGTFENNGIYWTNNNADFHITSDYSFGGHTGGYAWMATAAGGQGNNLAGAISQVVDLPNNTGAMSLKFSCAISVQNSAALTSTDKVIVRLSDESGLNSVLLKTIDPVSNPEVLGQWASFTVDLAPYKGTRKKLIFEGSTDSSNTATLRLDDVRVEVSAGGPTLVDLAISGADAVTEGTASSYKALANLSNGTAMDVTASTVWSVNENATISAGNLTALQVAGQRTARISASYTGGGITRSIAKDVTILDTAPVPVSLAIYGPGEVDENSGGSFSAVMQLSTGVYTDITSSVYWSFMGSGGQVDHTGRIFTHEVSADTNLTVKAAYEQNGVTVNAQTTVRILDRLPPVLPTSIAIVGPSSVNEAEIGLFDAQVTYADGSKKFVNPSWQENSRFTTISEYGVLACDEVLSNQMATLSISYTENSSTVTATKTVTIANTQNTEAKPEITMPAFMEIPVDRVATLRLQTAHPIVSATATGLPPGLTFNSSTFEIQGTPSDVGTWEIQLSATNDFGSTSGTLLLTVSEDSGPEWIRFTKAEAVTVPADGITSDGEGGCYLWGYNSVAHRNAAGVIDFNTGPMRFSIYNASGSPNGFAVTGRFDSTFTVGGRTINKFPNGEGEAVVIVFNKLGQALWHDTAHSTYTNVNAGVVTLNSDGSLFWGINYRASVGFESLSVGLELLNQASPGQFDCAVIKVNPNYTFAWGHRWGGNQQDEVSEIVPLTANSCRVKVSSSSSTLKREAMQWNGLFTTSWSKGSSPGQWCFVEMVFERGGIANVQLESPDYDSFLSNVISDPLDFNRYWVSGNFKTSAPIKRFNNGNVFENILLPAASTGKTSGFVFKSGFSTETSSTALFRSLAPTYYGVSEVYTSKLAGMSDGSVLSIGTYSPSFDYNGTRFLDSPQDYEQLQPTKRAFIAGHDAQNNLKWVLACGGANGGIPTRLERVGNDKWVMLINCSGDAKFGRLPVIPGGGLIMVDIERKVPLPEIPQADEKWRSHGFTAGEFSKLRAGGATNDLFSLSTDQGDFGTAFAPTIFTYSKNVSSDVSTIKLVPIAYSSSIAVNGSTVPTGSASQSIPLVVGSNMITVKVTAQDGVAFKIYTVTVNRAATASSISTLSGLTLSQGILSPAFASGVSSYTAGVANTVTALTVAATQSDSMATTKVRGISVLLGAASSAIPLSIGANTITIEVTAQDGVTIKTYTVTVTRAATSSSISTLSGLTLSHGLLSPAFTSGVTNYTTNVANTVNSMTVTPFGSDAMARIKVRGTLVVSGAASSAIPLSVGTNTITIEVTAQDGVSTKIYTVTVTRALTPSSISTLSGLILSTGTLSPVFSSTTTTYSTSVSNESNSLEVSPIASSSSATVIVNGAAVLSGAASASIPLSVGDNTITIQVTAQNGITAQTYTVNVTRAAASVATLKGLSVKGVAINPKFKSAITAYTARVGKATALIKITPTAAYTGATIKVNGTAIKSGSLSKAIALKFGKNTIKIVVTAQDGTAKTYKVVVTRSSATASTPRAISSVPSAESATINASNSEIARTTEVIICGRKYLQLTIQKEDPAVSRIVEVSANLTDWFSGDRHTTVLVDDHTMLRVRDNTPTTTVAKRYIRVRTVRN